MFFRGDFLETMTNMPLMLSIAETAERWHITRHYARQLALSGTVKAVRIGKRKILINQQSVEEYFNSSYLTNEKPQHSGGSIQPVPLNI